jgi:hypothetical protein
MMSGSYLVVVHLYTVLGWAHQCFVAQCAEDALFCLREQRDVMVEVPMIEDFYIAVVHEKSILAESEMHVGWDDPPSGVDASWQT